MLCSDGLSRPSEELLAELLSGDDDAAAERLVTAALMAQGTDNITAVTIDFTAGDRPRPDPSADDDVGTTHDDSAAVGAHGA